MDVKLRTPDELVVSDANPLPVKVMSGGGGGGGSSGSVTAPGVNGTNAQAIQGIDGGVPVEVTGYDPIYGKIVVGNARGKLRQGFDAGDWMDDFDVITTGTGDAIELDGNATGASYLKVTKSPFNAGTETYLLSKDTFKLPVRLAAAISLSQRISGQEFYFELVGVDAAGNMVNDTLDSPIAVSGITTATTTWTVNTSAAHGYVVGDPVQLYGFADVRFNLPLAANLAVTQAPSATQFIITGTNLSNASAGAGSVLRVRPSGRAMEAAGYRWSGGTANNANPYTRSGASSGYFGNEVNFGTTASTVPAGYGVANTYAHQASTSYELVAQSESVGWMAIAMDGATAPTVFKRMQALPDIERNFKMALRARNLPNLTVPVAEILTSTKSGTTTATHVTDVPHGLATGDPVVIYGNRDQAATSFPNITAATAVTVVDATTFTIVQGTAGTATTTGGFVAKVQGGVTGFGALAGAIQSISRVGNQLLVVGSGNWTGIAIGETAFLDGMDGSAAVYDGRYRVANIATTTLTLDAPGADFGSINCGGAVIKATDFRVHYSRALDYTRHLTEVVGGINRRDANNAIPVAVQPGSDPLAATQSGAWNVGQVLGTAATRWFAQLSDGTNSPNVKAGSTAPVVADTSLVVGLSPNSYAPIQITDVASAAITSSAATAALIPTGGTSYEVNIPVTAVTGTTPTMDVNVEESDDGGTNWFVVYSFPRITATGMYRSPKLPLTGNRVRYNQTLAGTTPSFTRAINRVQCYDQAPVLRQLIDRSVTLTTLNSPTPSINVQQCRSVQLVVNIGTATTPPALQLEGSDDNGATWYALGSPLTAVASSTVQLTVNNVQAGLLRARVSTAGATVVAGYVLIKGF